MYRYKPDKPLLVDYLALRKVIGFIGLLLPFVLMIGYKIFVGGILPGSISDYYWTKMGDVFVGALVSIGVFLSTYRGYDDDYISVRLAALGMIGVALFPTENSPIGIVHGAFAALTFVSLAYISLFVFTRTHGVKALMTKRKKERNIVYRICGIVMLADLALVPFLTTRSDLQSLHPMYWLETIALVAFGISWLVKGAFIFKDAEIK